MDTPVADEAASDVRVADQYRIDELRRFALQKSVDFNAQFDGVGTEDVVSDAELFLAFLKGEKAAE